jgi:hypothetical protein
MGVAEKDTRDDRLYAVAFGIKVLAEKANPRTGVEYHSAATRAHFDAGGVAAVADCRVAGTRYTTAYTPKPNGKFVFAALTHADYMHRLNVSLPTFYGDNCNLDRQIAVT